MSDGLDIPSDYPSPVNMPRQHVLPSLLPESDCSAIRRLVTKPIVFCLSGYPLSRIPTEDNPAPRIIAVQDGTRMDDGV